MTPEVQLCFDFDGPARNRHKARCYRCGGPVPEGDGLVTVQPFPGQRWPRAATKRRMTLVEHVACAEKYAGTNTHFVLEPDNVQPES